MTAADRRLAEALLRALRGMRHAVQAAEAAITTWVQERTQVSAAGTGTGGEPQVG